MSAHGPDPALVAFARRSGLVNDADPGRWTALTGGVSSDIWRLETAGGTFCVKRALARLKVADDWRAPVERNRYERMWFETANGVRPGCAPAVIASDPDAGAFAMAYLAPERHPLWKAELLAGRADVDFAAAVGSSLGRLHAGTARRADLAETFATDALFHALRLEPYLLATAERRVAVAGPLRALVARTAGLRLALVHGDVSPKNILMGPDGPVFLDAETAWYGDPAFDLAFCLNHLLLKRTVWPGRDLAPLAESYETLARAHLAEVDWEDKDGFEARAASLLPGLLLARIDGKSPVEYVTEETMREAVRGFAEPRLITPPVRLSDVGADWFGDARIASARS